MLGEIAASATRDLARPLVALNGLDPDTCASTLVAEPVDMRAVTAVCQALLYLSQGGLSPDDEAIGVVRDWLGLPDAPTPSPAMLGLLGARSGGRRPGARAGVRHASPPDPRVGEVDIPVDDLGPAASTKRRRA